DVYGEVMSALYKDSVLGNETDQSAWELQIELMKFVESAWQKPDEGIWEVRGPRRHFTHSKVMAWVAFDRAVKSCENYGRDGPVDRWRATRDAIHDEVCTRGFDTKKQSFVQYYGS